MKRTALYPTALLLALAFASCRDDNPMRPDPDPDPDPNPGAPAAPRVTDGAHGGNPNFFFLPPTVPEAPSYSGEFDGGMLDWLSVEVCALDGADCGAVVARLSSAGADPSRRLETDGESYRVFWTTDSEAIEAGGHYRVRVLVDTTEIGTADVDVTAASAASVVPAAAQAQDEPQPIPVAKGDSLEIRFRVEQGAAAAPAPYVVAADSVRAAAAALYDTLAAGGDATGQVHALVGALMPVFDEGDEALFEQYLEQGLPMAIGAQVDQIARAMNEGQYTSLQNFIDAAVEAGATALDPAGELTLERLTDALRPVRGRAEHTASDVVPALILALGHARAERAGGVTDDVWGDDRLDALQRSLLIYAFHFAGAAGQDAGATALAAGTNAPSATPHRQAAAPQAEPTNPQQQETPLPPLKLTTEQKKSMVDATAGAAGLPKTWDEAAKGSICASLLLNSYSFQVTAAPVALGRKGLDLPTSAAIDATLTFNFTPSGSFFVRQAIALAGCEIPDNGPAAGKVLFWSLTEQLPEHGGLTSEPLKTDASGQARATYETKPEETPEGLRGVAKDATGTVNVRALGLVPGWGGLEVASGAGAYAPNENGARLFVRHYEMPEALRLSFEVTLGGQTSLMPGSPSMTVAGTVPISRYDFEGKITYNGKAPSAYTDFTYSTTVNGCTFSAGGTKSGNVGFSFVASDTTALNGQMRGSLFPVAPQPAEIVNATCSGQTTPMERNLWAQMLTEVYKIYSAEAPFPNIGGRPITGWQVKAPNTLERVYTRTVDTLFGPVDEVAVYTLTVVK